MAPRTPHKLQPEVIVTDRAILQAVASLAGYAPMNAAYTVEAVQQLEAVLTTAQQEMDRILREAATIREEVNAAAWAFHEAINGIKVQVEAQFGSDSPALHAVGLKRRSEHKRPTRQKKSTA